MLKKPESKMAKLAVHFKCGDCIHFEKYPKYEKVCSKLGVERHANAPICFSPNIFKLQPLPSDVLNQIGLLFKDFTTSQARILFALLKTKKTFARLGLAFGMPVYICLGPDYLSNYYRAYVIGASVYGDRVVYVTSDLNRRQVSKATIMALLPDSIFTVSKFKRKRKVLGKKGRLVDPGSSFIMRGVKKKEVTIEYEPPTMETVPASWFDKFSKQVGSSKKKIKNLKKGLEFKIRLTK